MQKLRSLVRDENGSVLVIVAGAMVVLMGFAALVIDVGMVYSERARLMDTADAAALAGAQELPSSETNAVTVANQYIEDNGEDPADFDIFAGTDPDYTGKIVRVRAHTTVNYFFAPVLGIDDDDVGARAIATVRTATSGTGMVPVGINKDQERQVNKLYTLKVGQQADDLTYLGSGNFGALDLDGNNGGGANDFRDRLIKGYEKELNIGDIIIPESGNMKGPTNTGLQTRLNACTHSPKCTITQYVKGCPRVVTIPVYEIYEMQNKGKVKSMKIVGFSAFLLKESRSGEIDGYFLNDLTISGNSAPDATNYGTYAVKLIE